MQLISETMSNWAAAKRPLANLTKPQLFKYTAAAGDTPEAHWDFSKELIARNAAYLGEEAKVRKAELEFQGQQRRAHQATLNVMHAEELLRDAIAASKPDTSTETAYLERVKAALKTAEMDVDLSSKLLEAKRAKLKDAQSQDSTMSPDEILGHYRSIYLSEWNLAVQKWGQLDLFNAQRYGWNAFLSAAKDTVLADLKEYKRVEGLAVLVGHEKGLTMQAMRSLYHVRIMPSLSDRRMFFNDGDPERGSNVASLKPEQKSRYWSWWRDYNTMTVRFKWEDDSGAAYDERQFRIGQAAPAEEVND